MEWPAVPGRYLCRGVSAPLTVLRRAGRGQATWTSGLGPSVLLP
jgi:hypothetical protein